MALEKLCQEIKSSKIPSYSTGQTHLLFEKFALVYIISIIMKKSSILVLIVTFLLCIGTLIAGAYFLFNLVIIPKVVIPKLCETVESRVNQKLTITKIDISRKGTILIDRPILYARDSQDIMLECSQIKIVPGYKKIFDSWRANRNNPEISLDIFIKAIRLKQKPLIITGDIVSDFTLKLDLKNKDNIDWGGNISLKEVNIHGIPTFGNINAINGNIAVSKNSLVSYDIQGKVNGEPAKLELLINDFKNPEFVLEGELSPLKFNLNCALTDQLLTIRQIQASYNEIKLVAQGRIADLEQSADAQFTADISLELADLKNLPLGIKDILKKTNPQGFVKANITLEGPLKNTQALKGSIDISCPKFSLLKQEINNIKIAAQLKNGKAAISSFNAMFLESQVTASAEVNLMRSNLPFNAKMKILGAKAARIKEKFIPDLAQKLGGILSANIYAQGNLKDLTGIKIQADAILSNLLFDKFIFAEPIEANSELILKNQKDIIIKKLTIADGITSVIVNGMILNISRPKANLTARISTNLGKLSSYPFLNLPRALTLSGKPALDLKVSGQLLNYQALNLPFKLHTPSLSINQLNLEKLNIEGLFKQMKLDISSLSAKLYEGELTATAWLDLNNTQKPSFNLNTYLSDVNLAAFAKGTRLIPIGLQGKFTSEITISGKGMNPESLIADIKSSVNLENAKMNGIELKKVHANLDAIYNNADIDIKELILLYKTLELAANGKIESVLDTPKINITTKSNFDLEDLNNLPFDFKKTLAKLSLRGNVNAQLQASGLINPWQQMDINANITSENMSVKKIQLKDVNITGNLSNKILNLNAYLNSYEGTLNLKAVADLLTDNFKYNGTAQVNKVNIGKLIEDSKIIAQPHKGIFSLKANFSGLGTSLNTIESGIDFQLQQAQISGLELTRLIGKILGLNFLSNFQIKEAQGTLEVKNSIIHTQDTTIIGPEATIITQGDIGFNQSLDLLLKLILSPESVQQTSLQILDKFFTFENESYFTKLNVKGTITNPKPDLSKFMQNRINSQLKKEIKKQMFKALDGLLR